MGARQKKRERARELREMGVPFILRHTLAKKWNQGHTDVESLEKLGFYLVESYGCECCDPNQIQKWEKDNLRVTTNFGWVDYCARVTPK